MVSVSSIQDRNPNWVERNFTAKRAVYILTFVLTLQYLDRGIVAGAGKSIKGCVVDKSMCGKIRHQTACHGQVLNDTCSSCAVCGHTCEDGTVATQTGFGINNSKLGVLQSSFMVGYVSGAFAFAHIVHSVSEFRIIALGMSLWVIAVTLSGLSGFWCKPSNSEDGSLCSSYYLMVFARALSGCGEAALNTLSLPFLNKILDEESKGFYVGVYYTAIPVGTALGFIWAGLITDIAGGWEWAFLLEGPIMVPFVILMMFVPVDIAERYVSKRKERAQQISNNTQSQATPIQNVSNTEYESLNDDLSSDIVEGESPPRVKVLTLWNNVLTCLTSPAFILAALGYAVYTGVVSGMSFYGPLFIQGYRPCDARWDFSQDVTDIIFGLIVATAGFGGTILGGYVVDRQMVSSRDESDTHLADDTIDPQVLMKRCKTVTKVLVLELILGEVFAIVMLGLKDPKAFFFAFTLCVSAFFMVTAGINLIIIWSVPVENQPMAMALSVIAIHAFGDVPSPILIGYISDTQTPLFTIAVATLSMLGAIVFWGGLYMLPSKRMYSLVSPTPPYERLLAENDNVE